MPKEYLETHHRFIEGELNRLMIGITDFISDVSRLISEVEAKPVQHHVKKTLHMRRHVNSLQNKLFLVIEEKRRLMDARLERIRNKAMKPIKRGRHGSAEDEQENGTSLHGLMTRTLETRTARESFCQGCGVGTSQTHVQL